MIKHFLNLYMRIYFVFKIVDNIYFIERRLFYERERASDTSRYDSAFRVAMSHHKKCISAQVNEEK